MRSFVQLPRNRMRALRVELIATWLVLGGCTCSDGVCVPTAATPVTIALSTAGAPVTVTPLLPTECGSRVPTSVAISVLDPSITSVPATAGEPRTVAGQGHEVDISFTPTRSGAYHVVARFEPNFGVAQLDVLVAAEMRDAGSVVLAQPCARGDFTPGGLALCHGDAGVSVLGGGQQFTGIVARAEGTLWVSGDGMTVQRWVEDGGAFELIATATAQFRFDAIIPAVEDPLFLRGTGTAQRWLDAGIFQVPCPLEQDNLLWRRGVDVVFIKRGLGSNVGWCVTAVPGYDGGGERCVSQTGLTAMGLEPGGIWGEKSIMGMGASGVAFEALVFDNTSASGFTMPEDWHLGRGAGSISWDTGVFMSYDGGTRDAGGPYVLRHTTNGVQLENYGPDVRHVTSTCVTTSTRLIRR